jgi:hypothetical protein
VVLAGLFLLRAAFLLIVLAAPEILEFDLARRLLALPAAIATALRDNPATAALMMGIIVILVLTAILLWTGRRGGWRIGILVTGAFLLLDLFEASRGNYFPVWTALDVIVVFYLNQQDVRDHFAVGRRSGTG